MLPEETIDEHGTKPAADAATPELAATTMELAADAATLELAADAATLELAADAFDEPDTHPPCKHKRRWMRGYCRICRDGNGYTVRADAAPSDRRTILRHTR